MTNIIGSSNAPCVFAYLSSNVTNVTGNGTTYIIPFDTILYENGGSNFNTTTGVYTVPMDGNYLIASAMLMNNMLNSANGNLSGIVVNGLTIRLNEQATIPAKTNANTYTTCGIFTYNFLSGQTIHTVAQLNNGTIASTGLTGGNSPYYTWTYIRYLD